MWVEKYKPSKISDIAGNNDNVRKLYNWLIDWQPQPKGQKRKKPSIVKKKKKGSKQGSDDEDKSEDSEQMSKVKQKRRTQKQIYNLQSLPAQSTIVGNAVIISGPPGIGKTTAAHITAEEAEYEVVEYNASDTRNQSSLKLVVQSALQNHTLQGFFGGNEDKQKEREKERDNQREIEKEKKKKKKKKSKMKKDSIDDDDSDEDEQDDSNNSGQYSDHQLDLQLGAKLKKRICVIMDEVDGMGGGDRGGLTELVKLIDDTSVPIICICNDKHSKKMKTLRDHCADLPFNRPTPVQIITRLVPILNSEGVVFSSNAVDELVRSANNDIRQILTLCQMWKDTPLDFNSFVSGMKSVVQKNITLSIHNVVPKFFVNLDYQSYTINDRIDFYFVDQGIVPLYVFENYIRCRPGAQSLIYQPSVTKQQQQQSSSSSSDYSMFSSSSSKPTTSITSIQLPQTPYHLRSGVSIYEVGGLNSGIDGGGCIDQGGGRPPFFSDWKQRQLKNFVISVLK
ncbi:MAG: putative DNA replication factor C, large subunit [Streblomastix strix]|uniref:Putative DNA replication factor C, large subunit n=1 Tax=Streblomastix strix TaxID=222440 RepID=A0A5J4TXN0_9EUKA|nr:MAG: putative DNA replication factor C, large subunit [Streblomastix strix]